MVTFTQALKLLPVRALDTKCRISRAEFWWDYLAIILMMIVILILSALIPFLAILLIVPIVAWVICAIRRIHDLDMAGWWVLIMLVPYLGGAAVLGMCLVKGTVGPNRFGPDPYAPGYLDALLAKQGAQPNFAPQQPFNGQPPVNGQPQQNFAPQSQDIAPQGSNFAQAQPDTRPQNQFQPEIPDFEAVEDDHQAPKR
ncbi:MAG TPA: DUF805 domain-containing protein [Candidatus Anaerobiospirillum stercoravium]|nr:DUF805 domain-containing protein [Candidatus Anaerobiospirillum stercoravium]